MAAMGTEDDRLRMYCCDIFKMDMESLGKFDAVWDRASLVAIYEEDREKYAKVIKALLAPDFRYLISTTQYTPLEVYSGPPRNIPTALVEKLFSDVCELQVLEETTRPKEVIEQWGFDYYVETALLLTPRPPDYYSRVALIPVQHPSPPFVGPGRPHPRQARADPNTRQAIDCLSSQGR
ncbi:Thiopurine S-methyltransferase [Portunus trituberculatus]|uniref:Thiopurine S-methyltransferase n=1 Tax=Portunus trituberculatus TaxID=210409 RepID=A0A5B7F6T5_PORTR|nr:Thiopurine S-methyltransferase [Portunus trituberculatus]